MPAKESTEVQDLNKLDEVRLEIQKYLRDDFDSEREVEEELNKI